MKAYQIGRRHGLTRARPLQHRKGAAYENEASQTAYLNGYKAGLAIITEADAPTQDELRSMIDYHHRTH